VDESHQKAAKRFKYEGKMQKDKRHDMVIFDEGNTKNDKGKSKGKENEGSTLKSVKNYFKCSGDEKDKVHITDCHTRVLLVQNPGVNFTMCARIKSHTYDESWYKNKYHIINI
jgi:hypothetical protein